MVKAVEFSGAYRLALRKKNVLICGKFLSGWKRDRQIGKVSIMTTLNPRDRDDWPK